ncbi:Glutathione S-transferase GstA [wastewater metagenome]|uniref:Glutathione S-transferase GstA n=2 Tax=unclassified sequences TaxID=12908 RepID=A0A5B8RCF8_9ZZZZ|nr:MULTISPECIES: glutathione S-transferase family protein [Arhodomonas]MCS4503587.1 glutathione S-transferase family protein [Arhodomonas aquaeolei]QEA04465.1 glutathione S-transferase GstA [uncultured organism]
MTIEVFGYPNSRSTRVVWALEEAGAAYDYTLVDLGRGEHRGERFRALNPAGKLPALRTGDALLTESPAICLWVAETYPDAGLAPTDPQGRTELMRWLFFIATELEQPLWTMAKHRFALPEKLRVPDVIPTARREFTMAADLLADALDGRDHLVGGRFSIADILAAHTLAWARAAKAPMEQPALAAYAEHQLGRPALARARAREQSALESRQQEG